MHRDGVEIDAGNPTKLPRKTEEKGGQVLVACGASRTAEVAFSLDARYYFCRNTEDCSMQLGGFRMMLKARRPGGFGSIADGSKETRRL